MLYAKAIINGKEVASYEVNGEVRPTEIQKASGLELLQSRVMLEIALKEKEKDPSLQEVVITPALIRRYFCE